MEKAAGDGRAEWYLRKPRLDALQRVSQHLWRQNRDQIPKGPISDQVRLRIF